MEEITIKTISVAEAKKKLAQGEAVFIDIRDPDSYEAAHIPGAILVNDANVENFAATTDKTQMHIVYCYHGITSQNGAAYFQANGFENVYSMDGGFCEWEG
jgi:thiosulfate sulfurtransferase